MKRPVVVFAGNYREFESYVRGLEKPGTWISNTGEAEVEGRRYIYARSVERLRTLGSYDVVRYGSWQDRSDRVAIDAQLRHGLTAAIARGLDEIKFR